MIPLERSAFGRALPTSDELPMEAADGVDSVRRAARMRIAAGADWIKIRAAGWTMDPEREPLTVEFTTEELRAAVDEARAAGIRGVMVHTQGPESIANALAAGIRSIEHGDLIDANGIEEMLRANAVMAVQGPITQEPGSSTNDGYWGVQRARIRMAAAAGVQIVLGSDALGDGLPHAVVAHLADCGLGAMGAISAATIVGARLLGLADETGSIEPGKSADLLLFDGDPSADAGLWREPERVALVVLGGRVLADRRGDHPAARGGAHAHSTVSPLGGSGA
jgi:imidazolonepropionase-like amidohydrolase